MIATVRPASASDSIGWRPAKAIRVSKFTARVLLVRTGRGGDCRTSPGGAHARLLSVPEVRQPGSLPPAACLRVPAPAFAPAHHALGLGVPVDRADLDLAHHGAIRHDGAAALAVAGHLQLA